jgi:hypothetical protein
MKMLIQTFRQNAAGLNYNLTKNKNLKYEKLFMKTTIFARICTFFEDDYTYKRFVYLHETWIFAKGNFKHSWDNGSGKYAKRIGSEV